ncbi:MAG: fasciclin domain-containing protein, partial [Prevotella sp.]|nr:fasciclin domain-containing protein [Prevotella sp.]
MKRFKYIGIMMMAAGMLTATSCSDFDDYNEVQVNPEAAANLSLWENIEQNPQLSDFEELIKKAGFDDELQGSHYYTVWAPLNGTFDKSIYADMDQAALLKNFVYNHVADYNHPISGDINNKVFTLNRKTYNFTGVSGTFTFAGITLAQANIPSTNGLMHTLDGAAMYYDNIYDYILGLGEGYESINAYFKRYETSVLDEANSVKGPMVNGLQTYVDSVMIVDNSLVRRLGAQLQNEDSSYTVLLPTDKAWENKYNAIKPYYNFITNTVGQDLLGTSSSSNIKQINTGDIDNAYFQDSIIKRFITNTIVYSNNDT